MIQIDILKYKHPCIKKIRLIFSIISFIMYNEKNKHFALWISNVFLFMAISFKFQLGRADILVRPIGSIKRYHLPFVITQFPHIGYTISPCPAQLTHSATDAIWGCSHIS